MEYLPQMGKAKRQDQAVDNMRRIEQQCKEDEKHSSIHDEENSQERYGDGEDTIEKDIPAYNEY